MNRYCEEQNTYRQKDSKDSHRKALHFLKMEVIELTLYHTDLGKRAQAILMKPQSPLSLEVDP